MPRNRDLKDIQGGRSRVRQTRFECRQSFRAGVSDLLSVSCLPIEVACWIPRPSTSPWRPPKRTPFFRGYEHRERDYPLRPKTWSGWPPGKIKSYVHTPRQECRSLGHNGQPTPGIKKRRALRRGRFHQTRWPERRTSCHGRHSDRPFRADRPAGFR